MQQECWFIAAGFEDLQGFTWKQSRQSLFFNQWNSHKEDSRRDARLPNDYRSRGACESSAHKATRAPAVRRVRDEKR
ncbi:hypothetical protein AAFF_G00120860 [Aldrovandia affinis]|uniref:Uncharacterized protein n=1 Tax=Aldrovandia affinis TaxID=143900 RepID=A0AAD7RS43_9TELE|nr:hypothetical protein AAFF_G00120860 [Aldrovandia affinis]